MKAKVAPLTAVFLQPKWSVNMLTTGEQKKIIPMASAPTQAAERVKKKENCQTDGKTTLNRSYYPE